MLWTQGWYSNTHAPPLTRLDLELTDRPIHLKPNKDFRKSQTHVLNSECSLFHLDRCSVLIQFNVT